MTTREEGGVQRAPQAASRSTAAGNGNGGYRTGGTIDIGLPAGGQRHAPEAPARIKVIGVGGGGSNAVNRMLADGLRGVDFVAINTDQQALMSSHAPQRIRIGDRATRGLGAGGKPERGELAADESREELRALLAGTDMVFITCGMGGGTGTGAAPVVAEVAREQHVLTVGVVTTPFHFEGAPRMRNALAGIEKLRQHVDTLIVVSNDRLMHVLSKRASLQEAFSTTDNVLRNGVRGIAELITVPGMINLDFADVRTVMHNGGVALMGVGTGKGEGRVRAAAEEAINARLLEVSIDGATNVLFNVTAGADLSLFELNEAATLIRDAAHPECNVIFGAVIDETMHGECRVTVVATGFDMTDGRVHMQLPERPRRVLREWQVGEENRWWEGR
jgi:cell division protein FtsZ